MWKPTPKSLTANPAARAPDHTCVYTSETQTTLGGNSKKAIQQLRNFKKSNQQYPFRFASFVTWWSCWTFVSFMNFVETQQLSPLPFWFEQFWYCPLWANVSCLEGIWWFSWPTSPLQPLWRFGVPAQHDVGGGENPARLLSGEKGGGKTQCGVQDAQPASA